MIQFMDPGCAYWPEIWGGKKKTLLILVIVFGAQKSVKFFLFSFLILVNYKAAWLGGMLGHNSYFGEEPYKVG